jgi:hypothetical protein
MITSSLLLCLMAYVGYAAVRYVRFFSMDRRIGTDFRFTPGSRWLFSSIERMIR